MNFLNDYTIPEAEVAYQKAVIRGAWWFLAFLVACVVVYFIVQKIVQDRKDARYHARQLARIKATSEIGQTGFYTAQAHNGHIIREMQKEIERKNRHIAMMEETMAQMTLGDVADKIKKEVERNEQD
jgi:uncharacterized protein HemX